jgi:hypothetical protein
MVDTSTLDPTVQMPSVIQFISNLITGYTIGQVIAKEKNVKNSIGKLTNVYGIGLLYV